MVRRLLRCKRSTTKAPPFPCRNQGAVWAGKEAGTGRPSGVVFLDIDLVDGHIVIMDFQERRAPGEDDRVKSKLIKRLALSSSVAALMVNLPSCAEVTDPLLMAAAVPAGAALMVGFAGAATISEVLSVFDREERERELDVRADGPFIDYWPNGKKKAAGSYKNKKLNGLYRTYYMNGEKKSEVTYEAGERNGPHTSWHENGRKSVEGMFKDGKQHGPIRSYHENGRMSCFKSNSPNGTDTVWHENGEKQRVSTYSDGKLISRKVWTEKGKEIETE